MYTTAKFNKIVLAYDSEIIKNKDHVLVFIDNVSKYEFPIKKNGNQLLEIIIPKNIFKLESIKVDNKNYPVDMPSFKLNDNKTTFLGYINLKLHEDRFVAISNGTKATLEKLKDKNYKEYVSGYTGKNIVFSKKNNTRLIYGMPPHNSFLGMEKLFLRCLKEEIKTNILIFGELDFSIKERNGLLESTINKSNNTVSENFEHCIWNDLAGTGINDKEFHIILSLLSAI